MLGRSLLDDEEWVGTLLAIFNNHSANDTANVAACRGVTLDGTAATCYGAGFCSYTPSVGGDPEVCSEVMLGNITGYNGNSTDSVLLFSDDYRYRRATTTFQFGASLDLRLARELAGMWLNKTALSSAMQRTRSIGLGNLRSGSWDASVGVPRPY